MVQISTAFFFYFHAVAQINNVTIFVWFHVILGYLAFAVLESLSPWLRWIN